MDIDKQTYVKGSLSDSVVEFFRDYGVDCCATEVTDGAIPTTTADLELGSIVGFKGANVRGGLAFVAPASLVAKMLPVPSVESRAEHQLRDWSAEIANQLVGRLKNKLSAGTIDFDIGTPVCFRGTSVRLSFLPNTDGVSLSFAISAASVRVYLDCSMSSEELGASISPPRIVTEGDVVLF